MNFSKALSDLTAGARRAFNKNKARKAFDKYAHSPEMRLSKIYGYRTVHGREKIVPEEKKVIVLVYQRLAEGRSSWAIKAELDEKGMHTRWGNRWTSAQIISLLRPTMAGLVEKKRGGYVTSKIYPPIVSTELYFKALKMARKLGEVLEFDPAYRS